MSCMKNLAVNHLNARALSNQIGGLSIYFPHHIIFIQMYGCARRSN